jgi:hypothetical protein
MTATSGKVTTRTTATVDKLSGLVVRLVNTPADRKFTLPIRRLSFPGAFAERQPDSQDDEQAAGEPLRPAGWGTTDRRQESA